MLGVSSRSLELANMYANFGAQVTILNSSSKLLLDLDLEIIERLKANLEHKGITLRDESSFERLSNNEKGQVQLQLCNKSK
ncbi:MAG: NAD-binding protein, partial [Coriobacteriia bacterium]|nr:NAD-binding protein [Coriobacteriia bacterium]